MHASSVCMNHDNSVVLIGTQGCEVYELSIASKRFTLRAEGHYKDEVRRPPAQGRRVGRARRAA